MQDRCKFDASLMQTEETFTFKLDEETEKKLFDLLTDVDVSKMPSFTIKDKYGNEAEYVKVIRCRDCRWFLPSERKKSRGWCSFSQHGCPNEDDYCSDAERKTDPSYRPVTCDYCKHWHGLKRGGRYWCSKHSAYMEAGCEEGERKEE